MILPMLDDVRHDGIEASRIRRVHEREIRLHSLDLQQVVLPQDLHLVKRDQPVQARSWRLRMVRMTYTPASRKTTE